MPRQAAYPNANWGGWLRVRPTDRAYVTAGLYNGDPATRANDRHGVDGSLNGPLFAIAEAAYQANGLPGDTGMPGDYKVGLWYDNSPYAEFGPAGRVPARKRGNTGSYALFDQGLVPFGDRASGRGLGVFGSVLVSPDKTVSTLPYFFTAGVAARGIAASRPNDTAGLAIVYGQFSRDLQAAQQSARQTNPAIRTQGVEGAFELTYRAYIWNGGLFVQPDAQYIFHPGGTGRVQDALVLGCQVGINF